MLILINNSGTRESLAFPADAGKKITGSWKNLLDGREYTFDATPTVALDPWEGLLLIHQ